MNSSCAGTRRRGAARFSAAFSPPLITGSTDAVYGTLAAVAVVCPASRKILYPSLPNWFEATGAGPFAPSWQSSPGCRAFFSNSRASTKYSHNNGQGNYNYDSTPEPALTHPSNSDKSSETPETRRRLSMYTILIMEYLRPQPRPLEPLAHTL